MQPPATVVITTKNRKEELRGAIASALAQTVVVEVLVIDDGSTDGTSDLVRTEFAGQRVRLDRVDQSLGYIVQRNRGARLASAPVIVSIDDDAAFSTPNTLAQTLAELDHSRVGAVAIPFINVRQNQLVHQQAPDDEQLWIAPSYIGTAHALRRDVFLALGGYRGHLFHMGEERDYCVRMLGAGYVVRLGRADPIYHFESPRRDSCRVQLYGRRNDVLYAWHNVPLVNLPTHLLGTTLNGLGFGMKCGRFLRHARGLLDGYAACVKFFGQRRPVDRRTYRVSRLLRCRASMALEEIEALLPPQRRVRATAPAGSVPTG